VSLGKHLKSLQETYETAILRYQQMAGGWPMGGMSNEDGGTSTAIQNVYDTQDKILSLLVANISIQATVNHYTTNISTPEAVWDDYDRFKAKNDEYQAYLRAQKKRLHNISLHNAANGLESEIKGRDHKAELVLQDVEAWVGPRE